MTARPRHADLADGLDGQPVPGEVNQVNCSVNNGQSGRGGSMVADLRYQFSEGSGPPWVRGK